MIEMRIAVFLCILMAPVLYAGDKELTEPKVEETVLLWPGDPKLNARDGMGKVGQKVSKTTQELKVSVSGVKTPHLQVFSGPESKDPTPAVILLPGGAYKRLVVSKHWPFVEFLQKHGIRPMILKYRVKSELRDPGPLQDAQRAIRIVRSRARDWNIDPERIGLIGSSAGGHLSARVNQSFKQDAYAPVDEIDKASPKPDFVCLLYPAYLTKKEKAFKGMAPTMISAAKDDGGYFKSSPAYESALKKAGVPVVTRYYEKGGHGFSPLYHKGFDDWPELYLNWLKDIKILGNKGMLHEHPQSAVPLYR